MAPSQTTFDRTQASAGKRPADRPPRARIQKRLTDPTAEKPRRMSSRTRNLASVWALIAGVALAGAVSSSLSPSGRERLSGIFTNADDAVTELAQTDRNQPDRSRQPPAPWQTASNGDDDRSIITGSIETAGDGQTPLTVPPNEPMAFTDIAELSAEVARLRTENRRLRIERDALRGRLAQSSGAPRSTATTTSPGTFVGVQQPTPNITVRSKPLQPETLSELTSPGDGATEEAIRASLQRVVAVEAAHEEDLRPASATRFAIDIGSGNTLGEVRGRWQSFSRTYPEVADALIPAVSVIEGTDGTTRLHLQAGPLPNAADAVDLCARLREAGVLCSTTVFDGQRLASP